MNRSLKLKLVLIIFLVLGSLTTIVPSFYQATPTWWKKYLAPEGLRKGLDLQGGMHLVLKVNLKKAAENTLEFAATNLKESLAEQSITAVRTKSDRQDTVIFTLPNSSSLEKVKKIIADDGDIEAKIENNTGSFPRILVKLTKARLDYIDKNAVSQSLEILRNRIDQFGVAEPVIVQQGDDEIVVQLPGIKDPDRAMNLLQGTAQLEFKLVAESAGLDLNQIIQTAVQSGKWKEGESSAILNRAVSSLLPPDTTLYFEKDVDPQTKKATTKPILLESKTLMTGEMIKDAQVRIGGTFNEPYVSLDMTSKGAKVFAKITKDNVKRRLAIVLDDVVRSAPVIQTEILGGSAQITGQFDHQEATDLAIVLRVGALPAPIDIIQNMTVGASLGKDSISQGINAGLFGAILVLAFMVIYYRLSGIIANAALVLNILFIFSGLAILNATLTLPGIAGIVLSIGMAVDSNVLIFERMREELALKKSVRSSIEAGFGKAFLTIVDSQVTTLITGLALFLFGTGPVKGFAVTLSLGIVLNLFTALFCSRFMFDTLTFTKKLKKISFLQFVEGTSIDFMKIRKICFTISGILVLIGLVSFFEITQGKGNLGVDFTGGSLLQYKAEKNFTIGELRKAFEKNGLDSANLQEIEGENRFIVKVKVAEDTVANLDQKIDTILTKELPDRGFVLESQSEIGSSVSGVLREKAMFAILISLLGVIIYLAFRFDIRFGVAAAAATFHDVLVVLGICYLMHIEITLLIITALLTLAGYSLNDSVIAFDRIRENMHTHPEKSLFEIINLSINQVLGRTIVTGLTTLLSLFALFIFGGSVIHDFSFALLVGIIVGTYSSVFIASPLLTIGKGKMLK